ncbi:uncharacterized protein Z518_05553 [Rhinocladiella mackenziei CBS 650.93]|uniref:Rhinocladiella mackenziei CBS 650.93 unplaced genomic scaffold supercont1.4, whole genome shotgun sequence n=1 Tax=Rhinocladiella mackenziei CBS 650.93 TaxID=1442369 RepID=A0A0D2H2M2_9EURO|nr:uncharacterized protein Z518_05553 [Rhinocladiella mackenziei CBS 650.93]KIX04683.1 hypothetical protein Z518_05553 [Rhinocladiella mackenziei CBS 650.93]
MPSLFSPPSSPSPKINIASGPLPSYLSASQAPTKNSPWRTIRNVGFVQSATTILPDELYQIIWANVDAAMTKTRYAKVIMRLDELLQGDFFTEYIKRGDILMLSEGDPGVDSVFYLKDGILRLELSKENYERAGLQGTPIRSGGRKHVKSRYLIELNLRLPSMVHGKKGFERLVWAAKNVLSQSLTWLFLDLNDDKGSSSERSGPIAAHHPTIHTLIPSIETLSTALTPSSLTSALCLSPTTTPCEETQESLHELFEYVDMLALSSPRVQVADKVDPFISRYAVPDISHGLDLDVSNRPGQNIKALKWTGMIPTQWVLGLMYAIIKQSRTNNLQTLPPQYHWLALTVSAHKTQAIDQIDGYTILLQPFSSRGLPGGLQEDSETMVDGKPNEDVDGDLEMEGSNSGTRAGPAILPRDQSRSQPTSSMPPSMSTAPRAGFHHYLCAEYVDSRI